MMHHGEITGHTMAACYRNGAEGITVGERFFIPNYGYTIFEYKKGKDGVNTLIVPDNMLVEYAGAEEIESVL